jgi:hypothetical protein
MKAEFNNLVETLKRWDLYHIGDEVDMALTDLSDKIEEVEKRLECINKTARDIELAITKHTESVDSNEAFVMKVEDHDSILRGSHDIMIALDLGDTEPIENDWYGLFTKVDKEVAFSFESSWGSIDCDKDGNVIEVHGDLEYKGEKNYLFEIARVDIEEYAKFCSSLNITHGESEDILSVGFWRKDGVYNEADKDWRESIFNPKVEEEAPTYQCKTPQTFDKVKQIIEMLKTLDNGDGVDGETMQYILEQVGMEEQMLRQLARKDTKETLSILVE